MIEDQLTSVRELVKEEKKKKARCQIITIASGKGGVGKTNVAVNVAIRKMIGHIRTIILPGHEWSKSEVHFPFRISRSKSSRTFLGLASSRAFLVSSISSETP